MNSRTRSRRPASIGSNQSSRRWIAVSACDCSAAEFVLLLVMAWSPPALKRRDCLGFRTRRLRYLQFQPHPGRHRGASLSSRRLEALRGKDEKRVERARSLRHTHTPAEFTLWTHIRGRQLGGFKFVRQEPIDTTPTSFAESGA